MSQPPPPPSAASVLAGDRERRPLRVLMVEDRDDDAVLLLRELKNHGFDVTHVRVETADGLRHALATATWDVVVSDYRMPEFSAPAALQIVKDSAIDVPFLIISGTIGEETAVEALKAGAHDFLVKGRLARLVPAIERELREVESRRRQKRAEDALRTSEERFRTLVESMQDVVFTIDSDQRHDGMFGRWLDREGFSPERFLGKTFREILGDEAAVPHERAISRALAGGTPPLPDLADAAPGRPGRGPGRGRRLPRPHRGAPGPRPAGSLGSHGLGRSARRRHRPRDQ
jgi:DNA-binding response OmpR family regulator